MIVKVPPLDAYLALVMYDNLTPPFAEINFSPKDGYLRAPPPVIRQSRVPY